MGLGKWLASSRMSLSSSSPFSLMFPKRKPVKSSPEPLFSSSSSSILLRLRKIHFEHVTYLSVAKSIKYSQKNLKVEDMSKGPIRYNG